jgi:N-acetylglucosaminyldiphosphoundecaprenol N-acetyl-beta-D-mannosaminyltransferase
MLHSLNPTSQDSIEQAPPAIPLKPLAMTPVPGSEGLPNLRITMLGRTITCLTIEAIQAAIDLSYRQQKRIVIANYNINAFNLSFQLPWFHQFLEESEIVHCDGFGIVKALQYLGLDIKNDYRVSYTDLMPALLEQCDRNGWTVFLLGTKAEAIDTAIDKLTTTYPNAKFCGHHGYFNKHNRTSNQEIIQTINAAQPQILIVGMGMPIQEEWVKQHKDQLQVNAILVGGAVIDRLAGLIADCPEWLSKHGLEWVYRFSKEPQRLAARYLLGNPAFALQVLLAKFQQGANSSKKSVWHHPVSLQELLSEASSLDQSQNPKKRIGEYLVELNLITETDLESALEEQLQTGERIGRILADRGLINQKSVDELVEKLHQANQKNNQDYILGNTVEFLTERIMSLEAGNV